MIMDTLCGYSFQVSTSRPKSFAYLTQTNYVVHVGQQPKGSKLHIKDKNL